MVSRKSSLVKRMGKLKQYNRELQELGNINKEAYLRDIKIRYAVERLLFLIAESIIDFLDHILATRYSVVSSGYEDVIRNAYKKGLVDNFLYEELKGLGGFRNILAHGYLDIDDCIVYENYKKLKGLLANVIERFEELII